MADSNTEERMHAAYQNGQTREGWTTLKHMHHTFNNNRRITGNLLTGLGALKADEEKMKEQARYLLENLTTLYVYWKKKKEALDGIHEALQKISSKFKKKGKDPDVKDADVGKLLNKVNGHIFSDLRKILHSDEFGKDAEPELKRHHKMILYAIDREAADATNVMGILHIGEPFYSMAREYYQHGITANVDGKDEDLDPVMLTNVANECRFVLTRRKEAGEEGNVWLHAKMDALDECLDRQYDLCKTLAVRFNKGSKDMTLREFMDRLKPPLDGLYKALAEEDELLSKISRDLTMREGIAQRIALDIDRIIQSHSRKQEEQRVVAQQREEEVQERRLVRGLTDEVHFVQPMIPTTRQLQSSGHYELLVGTRLADPRFSELIATIHALERKHATHNLNNWVDIENKILDIRRMYPYFIRHVQFEDGNYEHISVVTAFLIIWFLTYEKNIHFLQAPQLPVKEKRFFPQTIEQDGRKMFVQEKCPYVEMLKKYVGLKKKRKEKKYTEEMLKEAA